MNIFLACPVRGEDPALSRMWRNKLQAEGHTVHWPPVDTRQDGDVSGRRICRDNRAAIERADVVAVVWNGKSQGVLFDLGMAFALRKPVRPLLLPPPTDGKSFQNMIDDWGQRGP